MTGSPLKKFVLTPIILSTAVFSALSLPLVVLGNKPVTIQFQEEPIFHGQLREIATPYLGLASALSLGTGIATIALTGWRQSSRRSAQTEEQLSDLERNLKEKEELLETLKLSKSRLEASGLDNFLGEDAQPESATTVAEEVKPEPVPTIPTVKPVEPPVVEPLIVTTQPFEAQPLSPHPVTAQAAAAKFASAQSFLGYNQAKTAIKPAVTVTSPTPSDVEELHHQLQTIMAQMASLQAALQTTQLTAQSEGQAAEPASSTPLKVIKSWTVHQAAS